MREAFGWDGLWDIRRNWELCGHVETLPIPPTPGGHSKHFMRSNKKPTTLNPYSMHTRKHTSNPHQGRGEDDTPTSFLPASYGGGVETAETVGRAGEGGGRRVSQALVGVGCGISGRIGSFVDTLKHFQFRPHRVGIPNIL